MNNIFDSQFIKYSPLFYPEKLSIFIFYLINYKNISFAGILDIIIQCFHTDYLNNPKNFYQSKYYKFFIMEYFFFIISASIFLFLYLRFFICDSLFAFLYFCFSIPVYLSRARCASATVFRGSILLQSASGPAMGAFSGYFSRCSRYSIFPSGPFMGE